MSRKYCTILQCNLKVPFVYLQRTQLKLKGTCQLRQSCPEVHITPFNDEFKSNFGHYPVCLALIPVIQRTPRTCLLVILLISYRTFTDVSHFLVNVLNHFSFEIISDFKHVCMWVKFGDRIYF